MGAITFKVPQLHRHRYWELLFLAYQTGCSIVFTSARKSFHAYQTGLSAVFTSARKSHPTPQTYSTRCKMTHVL